VVNPQESALGFHHYPDQGAGGGAHSDHSEVRQPSKERRVTLSPAIAKEIEVFGNRVTVYSAPGGTLIDPTLDRRFEGAVGDNAYNFFVDFGDLFESLGMVGQVPEDQVWRQPEELPAGLEVYDLLASWDPEGDDEVVAALNGIEGLDEKFGLFGWLDARLCAEYQQHDQIIARQEKQWLERHRPNKPLPVSDYTAVGVVRAGVLANQVLGFGPELQVLVNAKRHNKRVNHKELGIGLNLTEAQINRLTNTDNLLIRERAIASGSSVLALLSVLRSKGELPPNLHVGATVGDQRGVEQILKFIRSKDGDLERTVTMFLGSLATEMSSGDHPYYILRPQRPGNDRQSFAVSDGGDYADLWLPPNLRKQWQAYYQQPHIEGLLELMPELRPSDGGLALSFAGEVIAPGDVVDAQTVLSLRDYYFHVNSGSKNEFERRFAVGQVLAGVEYQLTF